MARFLPKSLPSLGRPSRRAVVWLVIWGVTIGGLRLTTLAAEICPDITIESTHDSAIAAAEWIVNNQEGDGRYLYEWDLRIDGPTAAPYNLVRHAGTTMSLYQFVLAGEEDYLEAADEAIQWLLDRQVGTDDITAFAPAPTSRAKLGTASLVAVGLIHRRQATGDTRHDDLLRSIGRMMVGQQRPENGLHEIRPEASVIPYISLSCFPVTATNFSRTATGNKDAPVKPDRIELRSAPSTGTSATAPMDVGTAPAIVTL